MTELSSLVLYLLILQYILLLFVFEVHIKVSETCHLIPADYDMETNECLKSEGLNNGCYPRGQIADYLQYICGSANEFKLLRGDRNVNTNVHLQV